MLAVGALLLAGSISACQQKLEPHDDFEIGYRPARNVKEIIHSALGTAGATKADGKMLAPQESGSAAPAYADIEFFPIIQPNELKVMQVYDAMRSSKKSPSINGIDLNAEFGFLIAHPYTYSPSGIAQGRPIAVYSNSVAVSYPKDLVRLYITAERSGEMDSLTALNSSWKGDIYRIPRRGRERLEVLFQGNIYRFSLIPAHTAKSPAADFE